MVAAVQPTHASIRRRWLGGIVPLAILALWWFATYRAWLPTALIAGPADTLAALFVLFREGTIFTHLAASASRLVLGLGLGTVVGVLFGCLTGLSRLADTLLGPTLRALATIPIVSWIPLFIILFGIGDGSKVALIASGTFFIVAINTFEGLRTTPRQWVEVADAYQKGRIELLLRVLVPAALPSILTGIRLAAGFAWTLLVVAEVIASSSGLGWLIQDARNFSRADDMMAGILLVAALGIATDTALAGMQRYLTNWNATFEGA